jgi:hypothetical protein
MKGTILGGLAFCALISVSATVALASTPSPWAPASHGARPHRANEIRFETVRHHLPGDEISLGATYYAPAPDAAPASGAEIAVVPNFAPAEAAPAETQSHGPRIIYIGKETERQKNGFMPQVIYGDLPSRSARGPEILYGDTAR